MPPSLPRLAVRSLLALALAIAVAGCSDDDSNDGGPEATEKTAGSLPSSAAELPDREPDVTGLVGLGDEYPRSPHLVEASDEYYLGMYLLGADPAVHDGDGDPLGEGDLNAGDEVSVWVDGGCDESFPVQCGVVAVQVRN